MKYKLLALGLLFSALGFGQSQVKLKSGGTVEGNIKSLINGVLTLTFKGNNLTFKQNDISAIYFVKPVQEEIKSKVVIPTPAVKAEVKGVVTYYFNKNYGDKPDVGAKIYLRKIDSAHTRNSIISNYLMAKTCRGLMGYKIEDETCGKLLKELNADTKEGFDKMNTDAFHEVQVLDYDANVKKVTVDDFRVHLLVHCSAYHEFIPFPFGNLSEVVHFCCLGGKMRKSENLSILKT